MVSIFHSKRTILGVTLGYTSDDRTEACREKKNNSTEEGG